MKKYLVLLSLFFMIVNCFAEKRLALVIGNSDYPKGNYLKNPVHDADSVAKKLKGLNFDVIKITDCTLRDMNEGIKNFTKKAADYDVALFFFAGHGIQSEGENYLIPIDAELETQADVRYNCTSLNYLLDKLDEWGCPMKIIVLDACRNNPLARSWSRSVDKGLAIVNPPKGTFITFSTAAGMTALDGDGQNSPYTTAFLASLDTPNLSLFDFFNEVGRSVLAMTNNKQDPWANHSTMGGRFVFNEKQSVHPIDIVQNAQLHTKEDSIQEVLPADQRFPLKHHTDHLQESLGNNLYNPFETLVLTNRTNGKLKKILSINALMNVVNLTISGYLDGNDFSYLSKAFNQKLRNIDLSDTYIMDKTNSFFKKHKATEYDLGDTFAESLLESISLPQTITSIGDDAFSGNRSLKSITIPDRVTSIGMGAFYRCSNLSGIVIPKNVTSIGSHAFTNTGLTSIVVEKGNKVYDSRDMCNAVIDSSINQLVIGCKNSIIPNTVTSIGRNAFQNCKGLSSIIIPNSVTSIDAFAFSGCSELVTVEIPNSVRFIGTFAFDDCTSLRSITLPNSVTSIESFAFGNCSNLTSITIPNSVTSIDEYSFRNCSGLHSVELPSSIASIGIEAFSGCLNLTTIYSRIENVQTLKCGNRMFEGIPENCTWYVPVGKANTYKSQSWWVSTWNIIDDL